MVHASGGRPVALFDMDGVLVKGDSFALFMRRAAAVGWRRASGFAGLLAAAPLALVPRQRSRAIRLAVRAGLIGMSTEEVRRRAKAFGEALAKEPGRVRQDGLAAAQSHIRAGDRVVVVTASEQTLARAYLDAIGLDEVELIASQVDDGIHNRGAVKPRQLVARGICPPWQVAYSDSLTDLPMLCGARRAVLVNASQRTLAKARKALGDRVVPVAWR
jgi:phosphatidylglycerophosphatase C